MTTDQPCSDLLDIGAIADMLGCTLYAVHEGSNDDD